MRNRYIEDYENEQIKDKNIPDFRAGDTINMAIEIKEGEKTRVQNYEGICISIRGRGTSRTIMIRKIASNGIGVERIFPLYSDSIKEIKVLKRGRIRRAKLFYLRELTGKKARIKSIKSK